MSTWARTFVLGTLPLYPLVAVLLGLLTAGAPPASKTGRFNYFGWAIAHSLGLLAFVLTLILLRNPTTTGGDFVLPRETALSVAYVTGLIITAIIMWISIRKHWAQRQGAR